MKGFLNKMGQLANLLSQTRTQGFDCLHSVPGYCLFPAEEVEENRVFCEFTVVQPPAHIPVA